MATRKTIRETFYAELETAASGLVPSARIGQNYPEVTEELPAIVHNDAYRRVPMNNGVAPTGTTTNMDGSIDTYLFAVTMQAQFTVLMLAADEMEKEDIYESVRTHFEPYSLGMADESDLHADIHRVEVLDSNSQDDEDREPIARGDALTINIEFERIYEKDVDSIDNVDAAFDIELNTTGDGTDEFTLTTN